MSSFPNFSSIYGGSFPASFTALTGFGVGPYQTLTVDLVPANPDLLAKPNDPIDRTSAQWLPTIFSTGAFPGFSPAPLSTPWLFWQMRQYSAIRLAFAIVTKPILAGTRTVEIEDDRGKPGTAKKMVEAATKELLPMLGKAMRPMMECLHFGNWLQEVVWGRVNDRMVPVELNSILPTEAVLHADMQRRFAGYQIGDQFRDPRYALLSVNEPHINPVLGFSRNENAKLDWWRAQQSNLNADKVERKASGTQMMLEMPYWMDFYDDKGNKVKAQEVIQTIINAAASGSIFTVPKTPFSKEDIKRDPKLADITAFNVEKFEWSEMGPTLEAHLKRLDMLDRNMIRDWSRPEREATEGQHGTKAEAKAHGDIGILDSEDVHQQRCDEWDAQVLHYWRLTNYGPDAPIIKTIATPLADEQQEFMQQTVNTILADKTTGPDFSAMIDKRKLADKVELPVLTEEETAIILKQQQAATAQAMQHTSPQGDQSQNGDTVIKADASRASARIERYRAELMDAGYDDESIDGILNRRVA